MATRDFTVSLTPNEVINALLIIGNERPELYQAMTIAVGMIEKLQTRANEALLGMSLATATGECTERVMGYIEQAKTQVRPTPYLAHQD
jgi:hypothetical protein